MIDFKSIFYTVPECYLLLKPDIDFTIIAVNNAYLLATGSTNEIIGKPLFQAFPDNPADPAATGVKNLGLSLQRVIYSKLPDHMPIQRYDTKDPETNYFTIKYWKPANHPVLHPGGQLEYIIHHVQDVTDAVLLSEDLKEMDRSRQMQILDAISTTQEMGRLGISQELHDNIQQLLFTARLYLEKGVYNEIPDKMMILQGLGLLRKAIDDVKQLTTRLLIEPALHIDLQQSLEHLLQQVRDLNTIEIAQTIKVPPAVDDDIAVCITRIVQELLSNAIRHSGATKLYFDISYAGKSINLEMKDNGKGFDAIAKKKGLGIRNIKTRVTMLDGQVNFITSPGMGCLVRVVIPL